MQTIWPNQKSIDNPEFMNSTDFKLIIIPSIQSTYYLDRLKGESLNDVFLCNQSCTKRQTNEKKLKRFHDTVQLNGITDWFIGLNLSILTSPKLLFRTLCGLKLISLLLSVGYQNQFVSVPKLSPFHGIIVLVFYVF